MSLLAWVMGVATVARKPSHRRREDGVIERYASENDHLADAVARRSGHCWHTVAAHL